ncbi:MAG: hypothetical protein ABSB42_19945 [Tepidisphaeraceae bacterium]|jgi:hypothetical protein
MQKRRSRFISVLVVVEKGKVLPDPAAFNRIHHALERAEREHAGGANG